MRFLKITLYIFTLLLSQQMVMAQDAIEPQQPATEVRAVWLTSSWGLDWPTQGISAEAQKKELTDILDELERLKFNVVLFQARSRGSVFYKSAYEPESPYYTHARGFDPLAFAIEECHKRGLECHAWFVVFPAQRETKKLTAAQKAKKAKNYPSYYKLVDDVQWYIDPGNPAGRQYIVSMVDELVGKYDIDGIHFDYIRYSDKASAFPDQDTYRKYSKGTPLKEWRRQNINTLVSDIYTTVKSRKKWVQVSSSPLGKYRELPGVMRHTGWTAYETVHQDAGQWIKSGTHDLLFPMMYHKKDIFVPSLADWEEQSGERIIVPGLGLFMMQPKEHNWSLGTIKEMMDYVRENGKSGLAYFRTKDIIDNTKGVRDVIEDMYTYPAKLPPLTWLEDTTPEVPQELEVYKDERGYLNIRWERPEGDDRTYTVYFSNQDIVDVNDASCILRTRIDGDSLTFLCPVGEFGLYYSVTATDRYHNESEPCISGFFSHSEIDK